MSCHYRIGALWIGGNLSYLEQLCLKSFIDQGQAVRLYTYEGIDNAPEGVELADANEVMPQAGILHHGRTGSPALHSDVFRYRMLAQHDDMIWADTDAYCVKPFTTDNGHFYAWESNTGLNGGVLGLPRDSKTLAALLDFTSDEFNIPPWLSRKERADYEARKAAGNPVSAVDMGWGAWGPTALTYFLKTTGEVRNALPRVALYPFAFKDRRMMLRPNVKIEDYVTPETFSIHLYGRRMRARLLSHEGGFPKPRSVLGGLLKKHGIDPTAAPLPARVLAEAGPDAE